MDRYYDIIRREEREMEMYRRSVYTPSYYQYFNRELQRQRSVIVCPVCASDNCDWWREQILRNNAGEILKDMLQGIFKGERYYDRGGGYREQEEYYQRMRQQFYNPQPRPPLQPVKTEDIPHDVVSTEIKGKPKKRLML